MSLRWNGSVLGRENARARQGSGVYNLSARSSFAAEIGDPSQIGNLALWLDGKDPNTFFDATTGGNIVTSGNAVARWEDKSSNALHYTQGTANNRPLLQSGGGLDFDGTNDQLQATNGSNTLFERTTMSLFIAFEADAFSGDPVLMRFDSTNTNDQIFELGQQGAQNLAYIGGSSTFRTYATSTNIALSTATKYTLSWIRPWTSSGTLRINGTSYTSFSGSVAAMSVRQNQIATLAAYANSLYFNGRIYEVVMYDRDLTNAERLNVQNYLHNKWGI